MPPLLTVRQRSILPTPKGSLAWCSATERSSLEPRLLERLLREGQPTLLDMSALAAELGATSQELARALFSLSRAEHVTVLETGEHYVEPWAARGLAALGIDLASVAKVGQKVLFSSSEGVPIARIGWSAYEAQVWSVRLLRQHTPPGERLIFHMGAWRFYLSCSHGQIDRNAWAVLRMVHRLLVAFAAPSPKGS